MRKSHIALAAALALTGCAAALPPSIHASDEDMARCRAAPQGCVVFTRDELGELLHDFGTQLLDAIQSQGKAL